MPLSPTPPNGKDETPTCITQSLIQTPQMRFPAKLYPEDFLSLENARGFGLWLIIAIASVKSSSITGRIGPKISSCTLVQRNIINHCGEYNALFGYFFPPIILPSLRKFNQTVKVFLIDNPGIVRTGSWFSAIKFSDVFLDAIQQILLYLAID